jgi:hypothetical protein
LIVMVVVVSGVARVRIGHGAIALYV